MSARSENQQAWITSQKTLFPWVSNWDIFIAGLAYPDVPPAEGYVPNYDAAWARGADFSKRLSGAPDFDQVVEEQSYLDDLNKLFSK
jgi:multiple sugar transport system substrate-binding protein